MLLVWTPIANAEHAIHTTDSPDLQQVVQRAVGEKISAALLPTYGVGLSWQIQIGARRGAALSNCRDEWKVAAFQVQRLSRVSVPLTCNGQRGSVVLAINAKAPVWTLKHAVAAGQQLRAQDLALLPRPITQLNDVSAATNWVGARMKKAQDAGHLLQPQDVERPVLARKGDKIEIRAQGDGVQVSVDGIATSTGKLGETVTVRNARTGKPVKGMLIAPGVLQVQPLASSTGSVHIKAAKSED